MNYTLPPKNRISLGNTNNALVMLLMANAVLFVLLIFFKVFYFMTATGNVADITLASYHQELFDYFVVPASFKLFIARPWTLISYMFTHESLLNLFSNLLWLTAFGYILQSLAANKKIIPLYLYGGIIGAILFLLFSNVLAVSSNHMSFLVGATPAIITVAAGATTLSPKYKLFPQIGGGIPLWILFLVFMAVNISSALPFGLAYTFTNILCALLGYFIINQWMKGHDYCEWMYIMIYKIDNQFNPDKKSNHQDIKDEVFYKTTKKPFKREMIITQERIDEILDKINKKGYKSLNREEREILERVGKE